MPKKKVVQKKTARKVARKTPARAAKYARSAEELAKTLEVSRQTIHTYLKLPGCPGKTAKGYDLAKWIEWGKSVEIGKGKLDKSRLTAKARKEQAQASYWEFRVSRERGDYVLKSEMETQWSSRIGKATALLRSKFENELPPLLEGLSPVDIQALNRQALDEVILSFHRGEDPPQA